MIVVFRYLICAILAYVSINSSIVNAILLLVAIALLAVRDLLIYNKHQDEKRNEYFKGAKYLTDHPEIDYIFSDKV